MGVEQSIKMCRACGRQQIVIRKGANHVLHLILSVLTMGLWLLVWLGSVIRFGGWSCSACGRKV